MKKGREGGRLGTLMMLDGEGEEERDVERADPGDRKERRSSFFSRDFNWPSSFFGKYYKRFS